MKSYLRLTIIRNTLAEDDNPFTPSSEHSGPPSPQTVCYHLDALNLIRHPERENIVNAEFISEEEYNQYHHNLTS